MDQPICEFQNYNLETGKKGEKISLYNIEQINKVQHSDGKIGDVFVARIMKYNEKNVVVPNLGDYLGFELDQETTKYLLKHTESQKNLMGWLAYYYNQEKTNETVYCMDKFFLGKMILGSEGQYIPSKKSKFVEEYFNQYVDQKIQMDRQLRKNKEENDKEQKEKEAFREKLRIEESIATTDDARKQKIQKRVENPYLARIDKYVMQDGTDYKAFEDYDGVNISEGENRGNILRIRKLEKVGKDGSETYLYSGYMYNTPNEYDVESANRQMSAVCFALSKRRLEDIVKEGDKEEIKKVLEFLSNPENFKNPNKLNYIGLLKRNFEISNKDKPEKNYVVTKQIDNSTAIGIKIKNMQKEFDSKNQEQER